MEIRKSLILFAIFSAVVLAWYQLGSKKQAKEDAKLTNGVRFSGKIVSVSVSSNHNYGIIGVKLNEANRQEFCDSSKSGIFPYRLKNDYAEFYGLIPTNHTIGFRAVMDSDKRILEIYNNDKLVERSKVEISSEIRNIEFVKKNTRF